MTPRTAVQDQCQQFVDSLNTPAFVIIGWQNPHEAVDVVQCVKNMDVNEYFKGMNWAIKEVMDEL